MKIKNDLSVLLASVIILSLLAGCANRSSTSVPNNSKSDNESNELTVIKIATQSPLSGGSAVQGEAIKLGAQMSLDDHKAEFEKLGFGLQLVPYDDQGNPKTGVANAALIGADPSILGVVGHLNSGVSIPSSDVYEKYNTVMVSPANTAAEVTGRNLKVVNRIVAHDDFQGPAAAEYAVNTVKAKRIFIIQEKSVYGQGLANAFIDTSKKLGAQIVGYERIMIGDKDFNGLINQVLFIKPDFIFFSGSYAEGGILLRQAREKGITIPFMGGDGLDSSGVIDFAGEKIKGALFSSPARDITQSDNGQKWAEAYRQKFGKRADGFSVYAYDSMSVLLNGVKNAIRDNAGELPSREQVRDAVRSTQNFQGIATKVSFDRYGDNAFANVYIYRFEEAAYPGTLISEISK
ncbi:branched-chain amino acid ABC transporter substrate-binding protein [Paenibacillus sedimenti]|uniref:Branched-chain amino acid ABC transporter substrate-binding protein n=1 Tax=Paenibacillus sedimenti TaxID=2770274 RepID=A0A926QJV8_9BACL|nr:branched-chain amino acid ABC transporter substrate-binding protein [Paenibacillus sedimenti]MBD0380832.1 branched-chain amino acid ABC transporter substrate-binding protein [Paenibacillus sedimenti]